MTHDFIKTEIPTEISSEGGAKVQLVNKRTIPLDSSIHEAKEGLYVMGDEQLIKGQFEGLIKSMAQGVQRDGHARQLGDYITIYPSPDGVFDLETGWDPLVNSMRIKARLLNELEIDITNWVFRDVTPGRKPFTINSVSTGDSDSGIVLGKQIHINGNGLPATDEIRIDWVVEGTVKSGTIPSAKVTSDVTRANIAADALDELKSAEYNGKKIIFTVRGNKANAKANALLVYIAPVGPTITKAYSGSNPEDAGKMYPAEFVVIEGSDFGVDSLTDTDFAYSGTKDGAAVTGSFKVAGMSLKTDTKIQASYMQTEGSTFNFDVGSTVTITYKTATTTVIWSSRG